MPDITLFFGAGAEVPYGLPTGGEFALEIFRCDASEDKKRFREELDNIDMTSPYSNWMPQGFKRNTVSAFGKPQREAILLSSLEHNRGDIIRFFKEFDENAEKVREQLQSDTGVDIRQTVNHLGGKFGESEYGQQIKISELIHKQADIDLFNTKYFGSLVRLLVENEELSKNKDLRLITRGFIEIMIGALGKNLIDQLNESLFENETSLNIFDDIAGMFSIDYKKAGHDALGRVLEEGNYKERVQFLDSSKPTSVVVEFYMRMLEGLITGALNYKSLIDSHFQYLYTPRSSYAKFCKIAVFLYTVQRYIVSQYADNAAEISAKHGYYEDLKILDTSFDLVHVATSNYNTFIAEKTGKEVLFLNGSTNDYYDPYRNKIVSGDDKSTFKVPLLFTQSGIKPLTSIDMTVRYADMYRKIGSSSCVVVCGFGFNSDDAHINGVLRAAVEDKKVPLVIIQRAIGGLTEDEAKTQIQRKLRLDSPNGLNILFVDDNRCVDGKLWTEVISQQFRTVGGG